MRQGCLVILIEKYGLLLAEIQHLLLSADTPTCKTVLRPPVLPVLSI